MIAWLLAPAFIALGWWLLVHRRARLQRRFVRARSERHEAYLYHLSEWLEVPEILRAAAAANILSAEGLRAVKGMLTGPKASEAQVRAFIGALVQARTVRRAIAKHMERTHGTHHTKAMALLMAFADGYREPPAPPKPE